jgi:hypothetical protein
MKKLLASFQILIIFSVTFTSNAQTNCNPATITNVEHEGSGNRITWIMPTGEEEVTISQQSGNFYDSFGVPEDIGVYHRFTPEDLATINGGELTRVLFVPNYIKFNRNQDIPIPFRFIREGPGEKWVNVIRVHLSLLKS